MMVRLFLVGICAFALTAAAEPARSAELDLVHKAPVAPIFPYSWTGFFLGIHGGSAWGDKDFSARIGAERTTAVLTDLQGHDLSGLIVGAQLGFNYQFEGAPWVAGFEIQGSWSDLDASHTTTSDIIRGLSTDVEVIVTSAARFGYALDRTLIYVKGGFARAREQHVIAPIVAGNPPLAEADYLRWGLVAGGGLEHAFMGNWSAKFEYNYVDFLPAAPGFNCIDFEECGPGITINVDQHIHLFKVGINYRWWSPEPAR